MGGGILPVAIYRGDIYFLFGRESRHIDHKASGLWSDFGGAPEKKENRMETAAREGWEETEGVLGSHKHIKFMVENRCKSEEQRADPKACMGESEEYLSRSEYICGGMSEE